MRRRANGTASTGSYRSITWWSSRTILRARIRVRSRSSIGCWEKAGRPRACPPPASRTWRRSERRRTAVRSNCWYPTAFSKSWFRAGLMLTNFFDDLRMIPKKPALGLDPRVGTGFRIRSCADKMLADYHDSICPDRTLARTEFAKREQAMKKSYTGGCQCGAVRYEVQADIGEVIACNCSRCRKLGSLLSAADAADFKLIAGDD